MESFNILSKALSDTFTLHLTDPSTGAPMYADEAETKPLTITLYGRSSKQHRNYLAQQLRKQENEARSKKKKSFEEMLDENADFLAAVSVKATNMDIDGVAIDSKESFKKVYSNPGLVWIADQVSEALAELGNFAPK